jgi:YNFM family putative membrane transporter
LTRGQLGIVLLTTLVVFSTLYTPQPILPQLARDFGVPVTDAALVITVTLLPLGLAPVLYGYFLQAVPARTMLRLALVLLALDQFALFFATAFWQLLALRFLQGLLLPALFTALMTYAASMAAPGRVRGVMGKYIAATIVGGFSSRALSGYLADTLGWQWVFLVIACLLLIPAWLSGRLEADAELNFSRLDARAIGRVLRVPDYAWSYLALFSVFFAFTGVLAMLPFRIEAIRPGSGSFLISLVYLGYMIGIPLALVSDRLVERMGGEKRVLLAGVALTGAGLLLYLLPSVPVLFVVMPALAAGMFLIHATLSGYLNHVASEHKGVVNGIYVSVYYLSGTLGSWLPLVLYQGIGWRDTLLLFIGLGILSAWFIGRLGRGPVAGTTAPELPR